MDDLLHHLIHFLTYSLVLWQLIGNMDFIKMGFKKF